MEAEEKNYFNIHVYPSRKLRVVTKPVTEFNKELQETIDKMIETMYLANGIGLAATQVGLDQSIFIYDIDQTKDKKERNPGVIMNPQIVESSGKIISENEGCLSVIDYRANIERASSVIVEGVGRSGMPVHIEADGQLAITLQHEIDHLNGILFIDHISRLKKQMYTRRLKKILRHHKKYMGN